MAVDIANLLLFTLVGVTSLITSLLVSMRYIKKCNSLFCSCEQDTASSSQQVGPTVTPRSLNGGLGAPHTPANLIVNGRQANGGGGLGAPHMANGRLAKSNALVIFPTSDEVPHSSQQSVSQQEGRNEGRVEQQP